MRPSPAWFLHAVQLKLPRAMSGGTTLLFALPVFRVLEVSLEPDGGRPVLVKASRSTAAVPRVVCCLLIKDRSMSRFENLPHGVVPARVGPKSPVDPRALPGKRLR